MASFNARLTRVKKNKKPRKTCIGKGFGQSNVMHFTTNSIANSYTITTKEMFTFGRLLKTLN